MALAKVTALLCVLAVTGCKGVKLKRVKGTSREPGISVYQQESRRNREVLEDFDRYDTRLDSSKQRPTEVTHYHNWW